MAPVTATQPPGVTAARRQRMLAPAITIGSLAVLTVALHVRDPHAHASWGLCPSAALGFYCPGCGGLRAVNDLTNGQVGAAASSNLLFVVLMPFAVFLLGRWAWDRWRGVRRDAPSWLTPTVVYAGLAVILLFAVLRNLPGSWLAP